MKYFVWLFVFCAHFGFVFFGLSAQRQPVPQYSSAYVQPKSGTSNETSTPNSPNLPAIPSGGLKINRPQSEQNSNLGNQSGAYLGLQLGYMYGELQGLEMFEGTAVVESKRLWTLQDIFVASLNLELAFDRNYLRFGAIFPLFLTESTMENWRWNFAKVAGSDYSYVPASAASHYSISSTEREFSFSTYVMHGLNLLEKGRAPRLELGVSFLYITWGWRAGKTKGLYLLNDKHEFAPAPPPPAKGATFHYRMNYLVPALSARFATRWGLYGMEVWLNYSPVAIFLDRGEDVTTKITSEGQGVLGQMFWGGISNNFWITDLWSISVGLRGKVLFRTRIGSVTRLDDNTGDQTTFENIAGSEYFSIEAFAGIILRF